MTLQGNEENPYNTSLFGVNVLSSFSATPYSIERMTITAPFAWRGEIRRFLTKQKFLGKITSFEEVKYFLSSTFLVSGRRGDLIAITRAVEVCRE